MVCRSLDHCDTRVIEHEAPLPLSQFGEKFIASEILRFW
jgi:hypothetical protein